MKILLIHNRYGKHSGEESVVESQIKLLEEKGHKVISYFRSSAELESMSLAKIKALLAALYNPKSIRELKEIIINEKPDLVHIHNLYPLISPAVLPYIKSYGLPIVMTVHNYRLLCPNGLFYTNNKICEKCTGRGKELHSILNNCEKSISKSIGYALRNFWSRKAKYFFNNVDTYICLTNFQKDKLVANGIEASKCRVINNMYDGKPEERPTNINNFYVGYVGRISEEKGIGVILKVAKLMPNITFKLAGSVSEEYLGIFDDYKNIQLVGFLDKNKIKQFYREAWIILFPSICYESFGLTLIEAMAQKKAIVASRIAGVPEIVNDFETGLLFKPNDAHDLKGKIEYLLLNPELVDKFGNEGFLKVKKEFSPNTYYDCLIKEYNNIVI